jgi:hypothetical protein
VVEVPGVGHISPLEAPQEISDRLRELAASDSTSLRAAA